MFQSKVYARVGLVGNPSDGFGGKTLSACVRNWSATVALKPNTGHIEIHRHAEMDRLNYVNLEALADQTERYGHYGVLRLIHATCALFYTVYQKDTISGHGFDIWYDSSIPRQVGLGGSSAIVVALLNCLYEYFELDVSLEERAYIAWAVENEELGIKAGLQDRVIQTYGGLVYMDFTKDANHYERLSDTLPNAFIAYTDNPRKHSGQVHNRIHHKFEAGDESVIEGMKKLAELADNARYTLVKKDYQALGYLMDYNFTTRLNIYGEDIIGDDDLKMIAIGQRHNSSVKLPGSGGAVVGLYRDDEQYDALATMYGDANYECVKVVWDQD